jgi:hypothetical protein
MKWHSCTRTLIWVNMYCCWTVTVFLYETITPANMHLETVFKLWFCLKICHLKKNDGCKLFNSSHPSASASGCSTESITWRMNYEQDDLRTASFGAAHVEKILPDTSLSIIIDFGLVYRLVLRQTYNGYWYYYSISNNVGVYYGVYCVDTAKVGAKFCSCIFVCCIRYTCDSFFAL